MVDLDNPFNCIRKPGRSWARVAILSVLATPLVAVLPVLAVKLGTRPDLQVQVLLEAPSVIELFKSRSRDNPASGSIESPLVTQAKAFALILNPPNLVAQPGGQAAKRLDSPPVRPVGMSANFKVHGTSFYASRPTESMALVSEPGSGPRWVVQGTTMGQFVLEEVKSGSIVYRDGDQLRQMAVEALASPALPAVNPPSLAQDQPVRPKTMPTRENTPTNAKVPGPPRPLGRPIPAGATGLTKAHTLVKMPESRIVAANPSLQSTALGNGGVQQDPLETHAEQTGDRGGRR